MKKTDPSLARLGNQFLGTWKLSGDASGKTRFEWLEKGVFLQQHFDIKVFGRRNKGVEIIGRLRPPNQKPSKELWSRSYIFSEGQTFDYVYDLKGNNITIWFQEKGSSNFFKGKFSSDGKSYSGAWSWPGGGYSVTATKMV